MSAVHMERDLEVLFAREEDEVIRGWWAALEEAERGIGDEADNLTEFRCLTELNIAELKKLK